RPANDQRRNGGPPAQEVRKTSNAQRPTSNVQRSIQTRPVGRSALGVFLFLFDGAKLGAGSASARRGSVPAISSASRLRKRKFVIARRLARENPPVARNGCHIDKGITTPRRLPAGRFRDD